VRVLRTDECDGELTSRISGIAGRSTKFSLETVYSHNRKPESSIAPSSLLPSLAHRYDHPHIVGRHADNQDLVYIPHPYHLQSHPTSCANPHFSLIPHPTIPPLQHSAAPLRAHPYPRLFHSPSLSHSGTGFSCTMTDLSRLPGRMRRLCGRSRYLW